MVSVDGTRQRRGHNSHNGVVTAISVTTGKALDVEVLSNYCKGCSQWKNDDKKTQKYQQWLQAHKCHLNHNVVSEQWSHKVLQRFFPDLKNVD